MEDKIHEIITDLLRDDLSKQDAIDMLVALHGGKRVCGNCGMYKEQHSRTLELCPTMFNHFVESIKQ
jgi:hypothetical protein